MELIELETLSPERRAELEGDEADPWQVGDMRLRFQPKEHHLALRDTDGTLVASAGLVRAQAQVGQVRFEVVGLGGVIVRRSMRGRGLGREVVEAAIDRARRCGPLFAVLFCLEDRIGFYRRLGFSEVECEVLVKQSDGYDLMPLRTMSRALRDDLAWPAGRLILHSLPF